MIRILFYPTVCYQTRENSAHHRRKETMLVCGKTVIVWWTSFINRCEIKEKSFFSLLPA